MGRGLAFAFGATFGRGSTPGSGAGGDKRPPGAAARGAGSGVCSAAGSGNGSTGGVSLVGSCVSTDRSFKRSRDTRLSAASVPGSCASSGSCGRRPSATLSGVVAYVIVQDTVRCKHSRNCSTVMDGCRNPAARNL